MPQTVQISSTPTFHWALLLQVLERQVLAALDDLIETSGLPLWSQRIGDAFVVHPAAG